MTPAPAIHGIIAYPITPFGRDGGVDTATLTTLIEQLIGAGVHAIAPLGSTGEAAYLTEDEFESLLEGKLPVEAAMEPAKKSAAKPRAKSKKAAQ